jgi:hypothetical protein
MRISEKQVIQLIEIAQQLLRVLEDQNHRTYVRNLLRDIMLQQSDELREVE